MITKLQFVILCRVEQGLPAFSRPLPARMFPDRLRRRREALEELYARRMIIRATKNTKRGGPRLTAFGRRVLNEIRDPERSRTGKPRKSDIIDVGVDEFNVPLDERRRMQRRITRARKFVLSGLKLDEMEAKAYPSRRRNV